MGIKIMPQKKDQNREIQKALYQSTIDAIDSMIHMVDRDLKILLANKRLYIWTDQLGFKLKNVIGKNLFEIFPFLPPKVNSEYQQVFESGEILISEESTELLGKTIRTETRKIPIFEGGKVKNIVISEYLQ